MQSSFVKALASFLILKVIFPSHEIIRDIDASFICQGACRLSNLGSDLSLTDSINYTKCLWTERSQGVHRDDKLHRKRIPTSGSFHEQSGSGDCGFAVRDVDASFICQGTCRLSNLGSDLSLT